jgi:hypothetical protein
MYVTLEMIECDRCRCRFTESMRLDFGIATVQIMEQLTRLAIDRGWTYIPPPPIDRGKQVEDSKHFCPDCHGNQKRRS